LLADVDEERMLPVDTHLEAAGGVVFRQLRNDADYLLIERELTALRTEFEVQDDEYAQATDADRTKLQAKRDALRTDLQAKVEQARELLKLARAVADAKVQLLKAQEATAHGEWKTSLEQRSARVEAEYRERSDRLKPAIDLADAILAP
jgi:hypothetical protein